MLPVCGNHLLSLTKLCFYFHFSVAVCFSLLTVAYSRKSNSSRRRFCLLTLLITFCFYLFADVAMLQMFQTFISKVVHPPRFCYCSAFKKSSFLPVQSVLPWCVLCHASISLCPWPHNFLNSQKGPFKLEYIF